MKKRYATSLLVLSLACLIGLVPLTAGELESSIFFTNLLFDPDQTAALQSEGDAFSANSGLGFSLGYLDRINDFASFDISLKRDPLLRNQVFTRLSFNTAFATMSVGPFFGPFNTSSDPLGSGISTLLRLEAPGLAFISLGADSSIGSALTVPGNYIQEHSEVEVGVWIPNVLASFKISTDGFTDKRKKQLTIVDERTRYEFIIDIFKKNVPYTAKINLGYQELSRSYVGAADTLTDTLGSAIVGMEASAQVSSDMIVNFGIEAPLYAWGIGDLRSPPSDALFFALKAGIKWKLPDEGFKLPKPAQVQISSNTPSS